ncbi:MAG: GNAT family N-acetyltransferase [Dokdonella sp.]|nr:GNAT family N-acetyltransferase [Dokdonella sp.]
MNDEMPPIPELVGSRLKLRALAQTDRDALFALYSDPMVMRHWSHLPWHDPAQALAHIERMRLEREHAEFYPWAASIGQDDQLIGTCSLFAISHQHARGELGFALLPQFWGHGLAREMATLAIEYAFGELGLDRIEVDIDPLNFASCRLVERLGFQREGLLRERWRVGGIVQDSALYGLLARDWQACSKRT